MARRTELKKKIRTDSVKKSTGLKVLIIILIILAACYAAGFVYFSSHFYVRSSVFGVEMFNQTVETLKDQIQSKVLEYQIDITTRDGQESIDADQFGLSYNDQGELEDLMEEQNAAAWPLMFLTPDLDKEIDLVHNESLLDSVIRSLDCLQEDSMTAPTDAFIEYDGSAFVIREETYGNQLDVDATVSAITDAILEGARTYSLEENSLYLAPEIYKDTPELVAECEQANQILGIEIIYDFSDRQWTVDREKLAEWIQFKDDFTYTIDSTAVQAFVHDMAYDTDTFGLSRTFETTGGQTIDLKGGDYGWCINQAKTVEQLTGLIEAGESCTVEPEYRYKGACRDTDDIGDNYIEISIANQTMWVYKDGQCVVATPVVTGNISNNHGTPTGGVWAIDARVRDYTLTGQDYNAPVKYWMPFNGNVGIHDASWRSEYGGDIYKTNGSHGCINTPLAAMEKAYESVKIGYPVIVY